MLALTRRILRSGNKLSPKFAIGRGAPFWHQRLENMSHKSPAQLTNQSGNGKFARVLLTLILSGNFFAGVVFSEDEPKTEPAGDDQAATRTVQLMFAMDAILRF